MASREELLRRLKAVGGGEDNHIDLAETALLLAALDLAGVNLTPYRRHLTEIAEEAGAMARKSAGVAFQAASLRSLMAGRFGYLGDSETYDDPRNANLIQVIDRRRGLPVALGILYLHAGRAFGAHIVGLNYPSHFVLRLTARGQRLIIDPFNSGQVLAAEDLRQRLKQWQGAQAEIGPALFQEVGNRDILIRLQNNIKTRAIAAGDLVRAVSVLETMTLIDPQRSSLWWELAVLESRLGNFKRAIATLESFLSSVAPAAGRDQIEDLLKRLRSRVN